MENKLDTILPLVMKPSRYTGGELNAVTKPWDTVRLKTAIAFPDVYEVGMSNLAIQIIYGILNEQPDILCERVFSPWADMEAQLREQKIPLFSLESKRPLSDFDLIGISLSYELSFTNALNLLDLGGIPLESAARDERFPLIFGGGHAAFNPEPVSDFFDFFIIGEIEDLLLEITTLLLQYTEGYRDQRGISKAELLERLSKIEGVYVPSLRNPTRRHMVKDLNAAYVPTRPLVPLLAPVQDRAVIEIMRGCYHRCRFCQAGYVMLPKRERSVEVLTDQARQILKNTGYEELSLLSLSSGSYSQIEPLTVALDSLCTRKKVSLAIPSIRMDTITQPVVDVIQKFKKTSLTLAPEAGTQRLRDLLNKNISDEDIMRAIDIARRSGAKSAKLYFMIGLPTETEADLQGIVDLAYRLRKYLPITISVSNFIPKPHTPFQWEPQASFAEIARKQAFLKSRIKGSHLSLRWHDSKLSVLEGVFARGDRSLGKLIKRAWELGCRFDAWDDQLKWECWIQALKEANPSATDDESLFQPYLRERAETEPLPWDMIETGVSKAQLWAERRDGSGIIDRQL